MKGTGTGGLVDDTGPLGLASRILFYARWKCRDLDFPSNKLSAGGAGEGLPNAWGTEWGTWECFGNRINSSGQWVGCGECGKGEKFLEP